MQEYAAGEAVELARDGRLTRREMLAGLVAICGTVGAATVFLAACSDDSATGPAPSTPAGERRHDASDGAAPPTTGGAGHVLSVSATDPDVRAGDVTFPGPASTMLGYLAQPAAAGSYPGLLVNHEIFGLTDHIRETEAVVFRLAPAAWHYEA